MTVLPLLHLCDSLFPTGGFAHSDGLEWATDGGLVSRPADLGDWMDACLDQTIAGCDGPAVWHAWHAFVVSDWVRLVTVSAEVHALKPSSAARQAGRAMGIRLVRTWSLLYQAPDLQRLLSQVDVERTMTLPAAFGVVCGSAGIDPHVALEGFVYTRLAAIASAAMRLMPIGQHEAHGVLASRLRRAGAIVEDIAARGEMPSAFAPALDIASMSQQYVHSRLFRS